MDTKNKTIKIKKSILAISAAATIKPVKPNMPAIIEITRNMTTQPNIIFLLF